jgi:spermidine synthase
LLGYEIVLLRVFSIALWHHFAYLILSIAMLGFGASGTLLSLLQPEPRHAERWFSPLAVATAVTQIVGLFLAMSISFEPFLLAWDFSQSLRLLGFYFLLGLPFTVGASAIALSLLFWRKVGEVYFADLLGAGGGALVVTATLFFLEPIEVVGILAAVAAAAGLIASSRRHLLTAIAASTTLVAPLIAPSLLVQQVSPYKGLSTTMLTPDARETARNQSPLAVISAVESPTIRYAPGLSLNFMGEIPQQAALFADGDQLGVITRRDGNLDFLSHMTAALPYHLTRDGFSTLVLGSGGGMEVLSALEHGAERVVAVEMNHQIMDMVSKNYAELSGGLYSDPRVELHVMEARRFVQSSSERFDIISISLLDSFLSAASGVHAASESYLYTVEALNACRERLEPDGILAITRWIKTPPRDVPRLFSTLVEVSKKGGSDSPGHHLAGIRSWATATLMLKNRPFKEDEIASLRSFCDERSFDPFWHPGIAASETNQAHQLARPFYAEAASSLLSPERESFIREYPFRLEPTTDDRPYFFHFFRWGTLTSLIRELGLEWIPFVEWGYLILLAVIAQALVASIGLLLIPFVFTPRMRIPLPLNRARVAGYFVCLGLGYLFIEVTLIQKFTLFVSHPVVSATTVISSMLIFSGLGSLLLKNIELSIITVGIALMAGAQLIGLPLVFDALLDFSDPARVALSVVLIAPLAFLMGAPFPRGLEMVRSQAPPLGSWAWGVNGFASVVAPPVATLLAISFGFKIVMIIAVLLYLLAGRVMKE